MASLRKGPPVKVSERAAWRPVFIEWIDASGPARTGWQFPSEVETEDGPGFLCHTLGWLVGENRTHYTVAPHLGNIGHEGEDEVQFTGIMHIPKGMVAKLKRVKL